MSDEPVHERRGNVVLLRLNRPEVRNALSNGLMEALGRATIAAESDPGVRAMVLTGTGEHAFCAGLDLKEMARGGPARIDAEATAAFMRLLDGDVSVPVIGAANASALGGGLEILLGCDIIVASSEARFGLPEVKRGFFPGGGGTAIARRVPLGVALQLLLTGDTIDAERAYAIGLVNALAAPGTVVTTALAIAGQIAANAPLGLAACKELARLANVDTTRYHERLDHWRSVVFSSEDAKEGAAAFASRRTPEWKGR